MRGEASAPKEKADNAAARDSTNALISVTPFILLANNSLATSGGENTQHRLHGTKLEPRRCRIAPVSRLRGLQYRHLDNEKWWSFHDYPIVSIRYFSRDAGRFSRWAAGMAPLLTLQRGRSHILTIRNETARWHPMHCHGHTLKVLSERAARPAPPMERHHSVRTKGHSRVNRVGFPEKCLG